MSDKTKDAKIFPIEISESLDKKIEDWMWRNRYKYKKDAIKRLLEIALSIEGDT